MSRKLLGAAAIIQDQHGRVLLVKHSYGKLNWDLPGGASEPNESGEETAMREVYEETGLKSAVSKLTGIYYDPSNDMHHFVFQCIANENQIPVPSSPEIVECKYYSVQDLPRPISDFTIQRIMHALDDTNRGLFHIIGPRVWIE